MKRKPKHVYDEVSRHGLPVLYYRKNHGPRVRMRSPLGSPEFADEYERVKSNYSTIKPTIEVSNGVPSAIKIKRNPKCAIYVVASGSGRPSKVEISRNPGERLKRLRSGNSSRLELRFVYWLREREARLLENRVIQRLRTHRMFGEWIDRSAEELNEAIDLMADFLEIELPPEAQAMNENRPNPSPCSPEPADNPLKDNFIL